MDYSAIGSSIVEIVKCAFPIGLIFVITERLAQMFFKFAFPKWNRD